MPSAACLKTVSTAAKCVCPPYCFIPSTASLMPLSINRSIVSTVRPTQAGRSQQSPETTSRARLFSAKGYGGGSQGGTTMRGIDDLEELSNASEMIYFRKQEADALRKLMQKLESQTARHQAMHSAAEKQALQRIVASYDMREDDVKKLIAWRHTSTY